MSKVVRSVKNVTKGYSSAQVKVRNATSNEDTPPTGREKAEIAALTFSRIDNDEIMDIVEKRLSDKGKNWRHVTKSLDVLSYCLREGSQFVVEYWIRKEYKSRIRTLKEFTYVDEDGREVGQAVRHYARELISWLENPEELRQVRTQRKAESFRDDAIAGPGQRIDERRRRNPRSDEEDAEYRLAIEASKHEAEEDAKRRNKTTQPAEDDDDLAKAIRLSKEEEELRRRELEDQNATSLFDDTPAATQPQPTGWNQGYQQQPQVDWFGNVVSQQPQTTGYLNNQYSQPQQTGVPNNFSNGFNQQPTGFDQSQFSQPNYLQQQNTLQPQQTAFNNPYTQQSPNDAFGASSPQSYQQAGTHNPWATTSQQQADSLKPMPTGSNNPFAQRPQFQSISQSTPALPTLQEQQTSTYNKPNPIANFQPSQPPQQTTPPKPQNPQHARLNALLASGEGQDTFGNTGDLRIPAQHTAPGTFVNSAGAGIDRLRANQTGANPFFTQQFTGAPGGFAQSQVPAQTGPVNGFGGGGFGQQSSNNPFGARPSGQQQGGSLIDL